MAHLTLAGVSDDGKRLLLVADAGAKFTVDIDPRLRAALRGDARRLENQMDSALRPRDIQARIRAGETPEAVAEAAQTSVDRIMAFAAPVLAERQHVADRAQRSSVRRRAGDGAGGARTLGDAVTGHLRSLNVDPDTVEWDAWRREDGRWALTGDFTGTGRSGSAHFTYDAPGNYVTADNDDARWLVGEGGADDGVTRAAGAAGPADTVAEPRDDLRSARQRRLTTVADDELPLGDDAIEMVTGTDESVPDARPDAGPSDLGADQPLEVFLDEEPPAEVETGPAHHDDEPPARRQVKKRGGRASVPSWDEIMFGGAKND